MPQFCILFYANYTILAKFREKKLHLQLNNFAQKLDLDVLWIRRRRAYEI